MRQAVFAYMVGLRSWCSAALLVLGMSGCERGSAARSDTECSPLDEAGCRLALLCEDVADTDSSCFMHYALRGRVFDADNLSVIVGASVVARDATGSAVSRVAVTDARGVYMLRVPVPRSREGKPRHLRYTLDATAPGYRAVAPVFALPELDSTVADIALLPVEGDGPSPWLGPRDSACETLASNAVTMDGAGG